MEPRPKRLIQKLVEYAALFALTAYLLRLGVCYLKSIWWILIILIAVPAIAVIGFRIWKNRTWW
jgi:hypothetical protein